MTERSSQDVPLFSIVTPSRNMLRFLPICCSSVADQEVDYEHIVIDGASSDGTIEWLRNRQDLLSVSEEDDGMYDAINKGIRLSRGQIISYLNCDEQYLPGALQKVADVFQQNPKVDILFGDTLLIRPDGSLLAYRKTFVPRWPYIWASHLYVHSSSMFVRRRVFDAGIMFDKRWRQVGDADFVVRVLHSGFVASHVREYLSVFMFTGSNLGSGKHALVELRAFRHRAPLWLRYSNPITSGLIRIEKMLNGAYREKMPLSYSVFTIDHPGSRSEFTPASVSPLYPKEG